MNLSKWTKEKGKLSQTETKGVGKITEKNRYIKTLDIVLGFSILYTPNRIYYNFTFLDLIEKYQ